jgi:hypothetical protein
MADRIRTNDVLLLTRYTADGTVGVLLESPNGESAAPLVRDGSMQQRPNAYGVTIN